ncbi:FadR family transcriptional regulator [Halomonas sp. ISL-60]|uniref:FadR/GntR family transcriptional regulator n=1 Tax=Halomonas sp. ISL-56 TaxID=2819149 RepID=UPI001BE6FB01|nr:FCD domain-containing protein [Halomonas sp. ISL-56]MBT2772253.1 FadR family transcriptional regulator [Halomonas sp. ISL-60]MBT2802988.1 FadR family transcriptional regulator [Halomonas sp. ISL-56]
MSQKRSDQIAEGLRQRILSGELPLGAKLENESALTARFSTSKWTLREALKSLETQGLVRVKSGPGGGAGVTEVSADTANEMLWNFCFSRDLSIPDIYALRKLLEPALARQVTPLLSEEALAQLTATAGRCCSYRRDGRGVSEREDEINFHNLLAAASPNPLLRFLIEFLNGLLLKVVVAQQYDPALTGIDLNYYGHDYHLDLIEAFRARDAERAAQLMYDHMEAAQDYMAKVAAVAECGRPSNDSSEDPRCP